MNIEFSPSSAENGPEQTPLPEQLDRSRVHALLTEPDQEQFKAHFLSEKARLLAWAEALHKRMPQNSTPLYAMHPYVLTEICDAEHGVGVFVLTFPIDRDGGAFMDTPPSIQYQAEAFAVMNDQPATRVYEIHAWEREADIQLTAQSIDWERRMVKMIEYRSDKGFEDVEKPLP